MMFIWYILIGIFAGRVGRLAFRHHGNMDNGCYREFDHGDRGGDCFAGDCFVVQ